MSSRSAIAILSAAVLGVFASPLVAAPPKAADISVQPAPRPAPPGEPRTVSVLVRIMWDARDTGVIAPLVELRADPTFLKALLPPPWRDCRTHCDDLGPPTRGDLGTLVARLSLTLPPGKDEAAAAAALKAVVGRLDEVLRKQHAEARLAVEAKLKAARQRMAEARRDVEQLKSRSVELEAEHSAALEAAERNEQIILDMSRRLGGFEVELPAKEARLKAAEAEAAKLTAAAKAAEDPEVAALAKRVEEMTERLKDTRALAAQGKASYAVVNEEAAKLAEAKVRLSRLRELALRPRLVELAATLKGEAAKLTLDVTEMKSGQAAVKKLLGAAEEHREELRKVVAECGKRYRAVEVLLDVDLDAAVKQYTEARAAVAEMEGRLSGIVAPRAAIIEPATPAKGG